MRPSWDTANVRDKKAIEKLIFPYFLGAARAQLQKGRETLSPQEQASFKLLAEDFRDSQIFILDKEGLKEFIDAKIRVDNKEVVDLPISLPFRSCFFERDDDELGAAITTDDRTGFQEAVSIQAMLVTEVGPNRFRVMIHSNIGPLGDGPVKAGFQYYDISFPLSGDLMRDQIKQATAKMIHFFSENLKSKHLGREKFNRDVEWAGLNLKRDSHRINYFIRIGPKDEAKKPSPIYAKEIEWSHQWWVRGHWRRLEGKVGKDRYGAYKIENYTWVTEHLKGPEDKEVLDKIRVVEAT